ncbi:AP-4 complex accessory subunit RUSC2 [Xyrauchen texanus]|uniref:AP-4 complex accessory subunit RUSC2 n=1 Tax=Xyrauchen texanus TaxID=154827 RepID=UPI0022421541|nr:AP-4 complex accessory subunit RUSC2 [Xyrauchen texanus]
MATGYSNEFSEPFAIESKTGGSLFSQKILSCDIIPFSKAKEHKEQGSESDSGCQNNSDSKGTPILMDCDEQDWGDEDYSKHSLEEPDNRCAQTENLLDCECFAQNPTDYFTDSSCNSSDGVLVNFSAIYNKTNNAVPATPLNLDSPVHVSGAMSQDDSNPICSWSSHNIDPNCNIYPLDSDDFSSMEKADLTMCLQSQGRLAGSTQNYYKLVTCDLSSQSSPSPAWSSLTSFSETHSQGSCSPHSYFLFGQSEGEERESPNVDRCEHQGDGYIEVKNTRRATRGQSKGTKERMAYANTHCSATTVSEHDSCNYIKTPQSESWIDSQKCSNFSKQGPLQKSCPSQIDTNLASPIYRQHATSFAKITQRKKGNGDSSSMENSTEGPSGSHFIQKEDASEQNNPKHNKKMTENSLSADSGNQSNPEGACASSIEVVRYTKAQRPASLPIQPFVLQVPSGKQHSKALGSLLNQYISNKYSKPGPSKATCKSKGQSHHMPPSPLGSFSSIHLAATSSDTCSTCTSSPILPHGNPQCTQTSTLLGLIHQNLDLMNRSPHMSPVRARSPEIIEHTEESPKACSRHTSPNQKHNWTRTNQASPQSLTSTNHKQNYLLDKVPLVQTPPAIGKELLATVSQYASDPSHQGSSHAISSVTSLTSITSLISLPSTEQTSLWPFEGASQVFTKEELNTNVHHFIGPKTSTSVMRECHHVDSSMADRPHEVVWLSPEATSEVLSLDLLHKRSMLKGVSLAVDLITAHFSSRRDPEISLHSSLCTSISQRVLKQLCPAIQNILQDGLKAYKLDLIIGQRRNKLWNVVEATARPGSSTRMPDSLVSVVKKCSQLSSHSMRLNIFIMDLLNLRALEFWIRHLYTCVDVVMEHYHQWGFLALAQGPTYRPMFQELLLLLQPLSLLPFDLHLSSEPHLQGKQKQKQKVPLPHLLLSQSAQILQMSLIQKNNKSPLGQSDDSSKRVTDGHWLNQTPPTDCGIAVSCSESTLREEEEDTRMENSQMPGSSPRPQEDKSLGELHWARLFGSGVGTVVGSERDQKNLSGTLRSRRPSEWLKLGASKVDLLAQSVWTGKWPETLLSGNHDKCTANEEHMQKNKKAPE